MDYTIHRFVGERWVSEESIKGCTADWVQERAKRIVEARQADRVDVVDQRNVRVFSWPRALHRT